jgi:hypothetical protein
MWLINRRPRSAEELGSGLKHDEILRCSKKLWADRKLLSHFEEVACPRKKAGDSL